MKRKFVEFIVLAAVFVFAAFALGFWCGQEQRDFVVARSETPALGLAPVITEEAEEIEVLDINTATEEQFMTLPGIGEKLSKTIVEFRQTNGNFKSLWELLAVEGIGEAKLNQILPYLKIK